MLNCGDNKSVLACAQLPQWQLQLEKTANTFEILLKSAGSKSPVIIHSAGSEEGELPASGDVGRNMQTHIHRQKRRLQRISLRWVFVELCCLWLTMCKRRGKCLGCNSFLLSWLCRETHTRHASPLYSNPAGSLHRYVLGKKERQKDTTIPRIKIKSWYVSYPKLGDKNKKPGWKSFSVWCSAYKYWRWEDEREMLTVARG